MGNWAEMLKKLADARLFGPLPEEAGPRKMTSRGGALHSVRSPGSQEFVSEGHVFVVMLAPCAGISVAFGADRVQNFDATTGQTAVIPAGVVSRASWNSRRENIVVVISQESMLDLAGYELDRSDFELRPTIHAIDDTALHFAKLMKAELKHSVHTNELYLDSLITAFGLHVLRNYSDVTRAQRPGRAALTASAAARVREYLNVHFRRKLTIAELANICGLSPGHFAHAFTKTFGITPHRYLIERRLEFAEGLLAQTAFPISEVAFLSGFSSQSHLTSIMKTYKGKTPSQLR